MATAEISEWDVDVEIPNIPEPEAERVIYPLFQWTAKPVNKVVPGQRGDTLEEFTGFRCRADDEKNPLPSEYVEAFQRVGMTREILEFNNGKREEHWLVSLFEAVALTEGLQTLEHVKEDNDKVAKAVEHNNRIRATQSEEALRYPDEVLNRYGLALGWAPERDWDTGTIKYSPDGKQQRRSFLRVPVYVRRCMPSDGTMLSLDLPIQLGFRKTVVDDAIQALYQQRTEILQAVVASEKCKQVLEARHKAMIALTGDSELKKSLKYWHISMLVGNQGKVKKKAKSGGASADVMRPGLVLPEKAFNEDGTFNDDWLAGRIIKAEERSTIMGLLDEVHDWACATSYRMINAASYAPEE